MRRGPCQNSTPVIDLERAKTSRPLATRGHDRIKHRLTVVLNTIDGSKIPLERLVAHYANATIVQNCDRMALFNPPPAIRRGALSNLLEETTSPSRLWRPLAARPLRALQCRRVAVLIADDDVVVARLH